MEIITFWFFWLLAISFNLLIIYLIGMIFLKGNKAKLHHFDEYTESDSISVTNYVSSLPVPSLPPTRENESNRPGHLTSANNSIPYSELYNYTDCVVRKT